MKVSGLSNINININLGNNNPTKSNTNYPKDKKEKKDVPRDKHSKTFQDYIKEFKKS